MREGSRNERTALDDNASIYTKREYKSGREAMAELKGFAKVEYFCTYYLGKIVCISAIVGIFIYILYSIFSPKPENVFYMAMINSPLDTQVVENLTEDMTECMVTDDKKQNIILDAGYYFTEMSSYDMRMAFMAHMAAHEVDAIIANKREFQLQVDSGVMVPIDRVLSPEMIEKLDTVIKESETGDTSKDIYRIMRYTPQPDEEYGADENRTYEEEMYGIDVTEFYSNFGASAMRERYYLGFVVNSAHTGQYETLLKYIFSDILGVPERTNGVNAGNGNEE